METQLNKSNNNQISVVDYSIKRVIDIPFEILKDKIIKELNECSMCLGKPLKPEIINHTSFKFAAYLQSDFKYFTFTEIDTFFMMLAQQDLGEIYNLAFSYWCKHMKLYAEIRRQKAHFKNEIKHEEFKQLESTPSAGLKTSFAQLIKENTQNALKMPYQYGVLIAGLRQGSGESLEAFKHRCIIHAKKNLNLK